MPLHATERVGITLFDGFYPLKPSTPAGLSPLHMYMRWNVSSPPSKSSCPSRRLKVPRHGTWRISTTSSIDTCRPSSSSYHRAPSTPQYHVLSQCTLREPSSRPQYARAHSCSSLRRGRLMAVREATPQTLRTWRSEAMLRRELREKRSDWVWSLRHSRMVGSMCISM